MDKPSVHQVELTPKRYKVLQLIGGVVAIGGFLAWFYCYANYALVMSPTPMFISGAIMLIGVAIHGIGRFLAWWNHR